MTTTAVMARPEAPIEYKNQGVTLEQPDKVAKELVRYVANLGDFIAPSDKVQLVSIGSRSGGLRIGHSATEGCPTMWRTDYMIRRAAFTPLEPTVITANADEMTRDHKWVGQRQVFPGDDATLLTDDSFREMGVVELSALRGVLWAEEKAQELNRFFFPDFDLWMSGVEAFPKYLRVYEELINSAPCMTAEQFTTQAELRESCRVFRAYANGQIQRNRARIEATKAIDMAGFTIGWSERTILFAEQLEITLEKESEIKVVPMAQTVSGESQEMIELKKRELALKERELDLLEKKDHRENPVVIEEPVLELPVLSPSEETCTAIKKDGEQCTKKAVNGTRCQFHPE